MTEVPELLKLLVSGRCRRRAERNVRNRRRPGDRAGARLDLRLRHQDGDRHVAVRDPAADRIARRAGILQERSVEDSRRTSDCCWASSSVRISGRSSPVPFRRPR